MAEDAGIDWFKVGRDHLWLGRPIDAALCLRRAVAARPKRGDARFHLGEALWQMGERDAARVAWREGRKAAPAHLPCKLALAEAALNAGDATEARDAAREALERAPGDPRARAFALVADAMLGEPATDWAAIAGSVRADPGMIAAPARSRLVAGALERTRGADGRDAMLVALASVAASLPLDLAAMLAEEAVRADVPPELRAALPSILAHALERDPREAPDAVRRLARIAPRAGGDDRASTFATRYAEACVALHAPAVPLGWPRRTAGARTRVAVLVSPATSSGALAALAALDRDDVETLLVAAVAPADLEAFAATLPLRPLARVGAGVVPDVALARALAERDPDLLIDACGLAVAAGPWFAQRPARAQWTLADLPPPLVDATVVPTREALDAALRALRVPPSSAASAAQLGERLVAGLRAHQAGDAARALAAYDALLADQPEHAPALHLRGRLRAEGGDDEGAAADYAAAIDAAPGFADARIDASRLALERKQAWLAKRIAVDGLALAPGHRGLARALGHAELKLADGAAAVAAFERALAADPLDAETHYNLGVAKQLAGDLEEAARCYQRAIALDPALVDADFNLGVLFQRRGQREAAATAYRRVIEREPGREAAWKNLGEALAASGRLGERAALFGRFEAACPKSLLVAVQALEVCQLEGDFARLEHYLDGLRKEQFRASDENLLVDALEELLYLLLFFDIEPSVLHRFARTYDASAREVYGPPRPPRATRKPGRLRVGYLSADLRDHVMGKQMWQAIQHHDRERFDLHFYSMSSARDEWTVRYESVATSFTDISALTDRAAARRIDEDDLDLLVDLQTHTKGARPGILAHKPARVQITHVASAGTLGMSAIDFKLTDALADLPEAQEHQVEPLLAMAGCVYPWRATDVARVPPLDRAAAGLPADAFVIGAFVTPMKLSRRCLTLWREVATRVPRALFLFSPLRDLEEPAYRRLMAAAGIAPERLRFIPAARNDARNLARYRVVDAVLDPMPFGNVNGTMEPLAMGVPVVALLGRRHGERAAASILTNLGVTATIAQAGPEYVDIAVRLAEDPAFMLEVRESIARGVAHSPLTDLPAHTRHLEAAYLAAIAQKAPEALAAAGVEAPVAR